MEPRLVQSKPISELVIAPMKLSYVIPVRLYLEGLGCKVTPLGPTRGYLIGFPEGTQEETYLGQSTPYTHRTTLRLPDGKKLNKYVIVSLPDTSVSVTSIAIPNEILRGQAV